MDLKNWILKWRISRRPPNSSLPTWAISFGVVNCLVVFPTHFNPKNSLLILLQISLFFMFTPALKYLSYENFNFEIKKGDAHDQ